MVSYLPPTIVVSARKHKTLHQTTKRTSTTTVHRARNYSHRPLCGRTHCQQHRKARTAGNGVKDDKPPEPNFKGLNNITSASLIITLFAFERWRKGKSKQHQLRRSPLWPNDSNVPSVPMVSVWDGICAMGMVLKDGS